MTNDTVTSCSVIVCEKMVKKTMFPGHERTLSGRHVPCRRCFGTRTAGNLRVFASGACGADGNESYASLSNGWEPHFTGMGACGLSFEYTRCGGLYANPVIPTDCPDPGVLRTSDGYVLSCTSGDDGDAFPIYTSPDLVAWTPVGHIFPSGHWPSWAASDFWAPEIHLVGSHFVAYFAARNSAGAPKSPGRTWRSLGLASLIPRPLLPRGEKGCQRRSRRRDLPLLPSWEKGGRGVEGRAKVGAVISTGSLRAPRAARVMGCAFGSEEASPARRRGATPPPTRCHSPHRGPARASPR
jgi:hypothetical protein